MGVFCRKVCSVDGCDAGGGGATRLQRRSSVAIDPDALRAADRRAERIAEILRCPVVDDGIDAGVEVGQSSAEHEDGS